MLGLMRTRLLSPRDTKAGQVPHAALEAQLASHQVLPPKHLENGKYCRGQPQPTYLPLAATKPAGMVQVRPLGVPPRLAQLWRSWMASPIGSAGCQMGQGVVGQSHWSPKQGTRKNKSTKQKQQSNDLVFGPSIKRQKGQTGMAGGTADLAMMLTAELSLTAIKRCVLFVLLTTDSSPNPAGF